jgi:hypothetical protein
MSNERSFVSSLAPISRGDGVPQNRPCRGLMTPTAHRMRVGSRMPPLRADEERSRLTAVATSWLNVAAGGWHG